MIFSSGFSSLKILEAKAYENCMLVVVIMDEVSLLCCAPVKPPSISALIPILDGLCAFEKLTLDLWRKFVLFISTADGVL